MSAEIRARAMAAGGVSPGEHLRAEIRRLALDQGAVGKATGVSRQSINNIINGRQPVSRAMAIKLGRLTGHGPDYWLRASFASDCDDPLPTGGRTLPARAGILANQQIAQAVERGLIAIEPFTASRMRAASVDLTLGHVVVAGGTEVDIRGVKGFLPRAGRCVAASTTERIMLSRNHVGRVGALHHVVSAGIIMSHAFQIEPGFSGRLHFQLFNAGNAPFRLIGGAGDRPRDHPDQRRRARRAVARVTLVTIFS